MKAYLKNYRQAPRKVRLVADSVRGVNVATAIQNLTFMPKKAATPIKKLLESAAANAKVNENLNTEDLRVKEILVDKGFTFKRFRARARGRAAPIRKETSHVRVTLERN